MQFKTYQPSEPIINYIETVFHFRDFNPDHSIERVVPTGHIFIIFELDGYERHTYDNETLKPNANFTKVWISGMHRNYISISAHENSEMFVIQFKAQGAYPFLHFPIEELNEQIVEGEAILNGELLKLRDELLKPETSEGKFKIAEDWLNSRFDQTKTPPADFLNALEQLQAEAAANYDEIIEKYPNTQKHLIDQFKKYVGLTPKYYQRILRFNDLLQKLHEQEKIAWADIAYQSGYSDQSHFIKEFKHFSGFNPQEFIKQEFNKDDPNFFPLDRQG